MAKPFRTAAAFRSFRSGANPTALYDHARGAGQKSFAELKSLVPHREPLEILGSSNMLKPSPTFKRCDRQEIKGDDTPVLQSVLEADKEREWLLKVEQEPGKTWRIGCWTNALPHLSESHFQLQLADPDLAGLILPQDF